MELTHEVFEGAREVGRVCIGGHTGRKEGERERERERERRESHIAVDS